MPETPDRKALIEALMKGSERSREQYYEIGEFIHVYSQIEFSLKFIFSDLMRPPPDAFDELTGSLDFVSLCHVVLASVRRRIGDRPSFEPFPGIISRLKAVNDDRIKIVHGTWTDGLEASTISNAEDAGLSLRHVSRNSLVAKVHFDKPGELGALIMRAHNVHGDLLKTFLSARPEINSARPKRQEHD